MFNNVLGERPKRHSIWIPSGAPSSAWASSLRALFDWVAVVVFLEKTGFVVGKLSNKRQIKGKCPEVEVVEGEKTLNYSLLLNNYPSNVRVNTLENN